MTELHKYQVGALYHPARTSWPERGEYNYRSNSHELRLFFDRPSEAEIEAAARGPAEFALLVAGPVLMFCYRFGAPGAAPPSLTASLQGAPGIPWGDAPYHFGLVPGEEQTPPFALPTPQSRALLHVVLVGAHDGIIKALRAVTLSPEFTQALHSAIYDQARPPAGRAPAFRQGEFDQALKELYERFPTSDALAAAGYRCQGGEP